MRFLPSHFNTKKVICNYLLEKNIDFFILFRRKTVRKRKKTPKKRKTIFKMKKKRFHKMEERASLRLVDKMSYFK